VPEGKRPARFSKLERSESKKAPKEFSLGARFLN
jgi:hypothetical protein